jgi:hypothetical protein
MKTIVICASAHFYPQVIEAEAQLKKKGFRVAIPYGAEKMKSSDYVAKDSKTWLTNPADYHIKADFMRRHFDKVAAGDIVLVLNYEKNGKQNYIGANVMMEMALAFHLKKPIYVLNEIPQDSPFIEEILGMGSISLHGKLEDLPTE